MDPEVRIGPPKDPTEDPYMRAERLLQELRKMSSVENLDEDEPVVNVLRYLQPHEEVDMFKGDQMCWYCRASSAILRQCRGCGKPRYVSEH